MTSWQPPAADAPASGPTPDPGAAFAFCAGCGQRIAFTAPRCPRCGLARAGVGSDEEVASPKSYGVAVALCGVFGVLGVHHFYIGNHLHGFLDVLLVVVFCVLLAFNSPFALFVLLIDVIHTTYVFFVLIVGKQRDGQGRLIRTPTQT
nr:TM2 domain-containing protein [Roseospira marina]